MHLGNWVDTIGTGFFFGVGFTLAGGVLNWLASLVRRG